MSAGRDGPSSGDVLAGILLILFGLCIALVGGGCTVLWLVVLDGSSGGNGQELLLLLLSIGAAGLGVLSITIGVRKLRGGSGGAA